ncbi:head-tail connector protein [Morganella psychrotolerans]|uniref:head-tail connector protein n=1 Tax=Morganella psychrotolerans TaxID=368603 RepID=UPI0039AFFC1E
MPLPTLEKLRAQCRIDEDNDLEDTLLQTYLGAAKSRAENYTNRTLYDSDIPDTDPDGLLISDDIEVAMLIFVSYLYECRENAAIPASFFSLLGPYRFIPL